LTSDGPSRLETDVPWYSSDEPRFPCRSFQIQSPYWVRTGRSRPSWWFRILTSFSLANGPRMFRPTFPGRSCAAANTSTLSSQSVISARAKRLSRNLPPPQPRGGNRRFPHEPPPRRGGNRRFPHEPPSLRSHATSRDVAPPSKARLRWKNRVRPRSAVSGRRAWCAAAGMPGGPSPSGQRRVAEPDRPLRVCDVALEVRRSRRQVGVEVREDHRRVVEQDLLHLLRVAALVRERDRADVRLRRCVELRVRVVRRVPDAFRLERRRQVDVRHRTMAPVGDVHRRVQPRRVPPAGRRPELRAGEVLRRRQDLELHVDPDRADGLLDDLRELRDLARLLRRQRDLEALRVAGRGHQLLRLADVLVPLRH